MPIVLSRRHVLLVTLATLIAAPAVHAQPVTRRARVGVLASSTEANFLPSVKVFRDTLRTAGWVEGQNLTLEVRYGGEGYTHLPEMATELVQLKVDVIASLGTPATEAAKRATTTVPIVMESLSDVSRTTAWSRTWRGPAATSPGCRGSRPS